MKQANRRSPPILSGAIIEIGEQIGNGRGFAAHHTKVTERNGEKKALALKYARNWPISPKSTLLKAQKVLVRLREIGLPVPRFSKIDLRRRSTTHLHLFQPNLERLGKLIPVNNSEGLPVFLRELDLKKDRDLIRVLARDTTTLHRNGFMTPIIDFWHFYKRGKSYGRIILDVEFLVPSKKITQTHIIHTLSTIDKYLGREEMQCFAREYAKHCPNKEIAKRILWLYIPHHTRRVEQQRRLAKKSK